MARRFAILLALIGTIVVSGCASTGNRAEREPFRITDVQVVSAITTPTATALEPAIRQHAVAAATARPEAGAEKTLRLTLTDIHYKNAARSLLVGDTHRLTGYATVVDDASGRDEGSIEVIGTDDIWMQGVAGLIQSAATDRARAEADLAKSFGETSVRNIYRRRWTPTAEVAAKQGQVYVAPVAVAPLGPGSSAAEPVVVR